jgi:hypothetical protein
MGKEIKRATGTHVLESADGGTTQNGKETERATGTHQLERQIEIDKREHQTKSDRTVGRVRNKNLEDKMSQG